jgi:hypothetical protein
MGIGNIGNTGGVLPQQKTAAPADSTAVKGSIGGITREITLGPQPGGHQAVSKTQREAFRQLGKLPAKEFFGQAQQTPFNPASSLEKRVVTQQKAIAEEALAFRPSLKTTNKTQQMAFRQLGKTTAPQPDLPKVDKPSTAPLKSEAKTEKAKVEGEKVVSEQPKPSWKEHKFKELSANSQEFNENYGKMVKLHEATLKKVSLLPTGKNLLHFNKYMKMHKDLKEFVKISKELQKEVEKFENHINEVASNPNLSDDEKAKQIANIVKTELPDPEKVKKYIQLQRKLNKDNDFFKLNSAASAETGISSSKFSSILLIQRIPKYELHLKEMIKEFGGSEKTELESAYSSIQSYLNNVNKSV